MPLKTFPEETMASCSQKGIYAFRLFIPMCTKISWQFMAQIKKPRMLNLIVFKYLIKASSKAKKASPRNTFPRLRMATEKAQPEIPIG